MPPYCAPEVVDDGDGRGQVAKWLTQARFVNLERTKNEMHCKRCGVELQNEARYCWKCGLAVTEGAAVLYKTCLLEKHSVALGLRIQWRAIVQGAVVAESREVSAFGIGDSLTREVFSANHELAMLLLAQGWEPLATNEHGWIVSMRREKTR